MTELGPCPRCGSRMEVFGTRIDGHEWKMAKCEKSATNECGYETDLVYDEEQLATVHNYISEGCAFHRRYKHEPVEEALELWRLLVWAVARGDIAYDFDGRHATVAVYNDDWEDIAQGTDIFSALREARKELGNKHD